MNERLYSTAYATIESPQGVLYTTLSKCVVVINAIEKFGEIPKRISLEALDALFGDL